MREIVSFLKKAGKLKEIKREGWLRVGIKNAESVASHSYRVSLIAMVVGDKLNLNVEKLLKMALLHDLAEAKIGDITPYEMKKEEKIELERKAMKDILYNFDEYFNLWIEYIEGESEEARLLQEIDKFEMILQAYEYGEKYGMEKIKEFLEEKENIRHPFLKELLSILSSR